MIYKYKYLIYLILFLSARVCLAQKVPVSEIHIGEQVPNVMLSGWLGDTTKNVKFSDLYKNKLLILDFWATWCTSCMEETRILDSLKTIFGNQINIVVVGYEPYSQIDRFFKIHPNLKPNYLRILTDDKTLLSYFPHFGIPHEVWIGSSGKVLAITGGEDVTEKNISKFITTNKINLEEKRDILNFDVTKPFHLEDTTFSGRSLFTKRAKGVEAYDGGTGTNRVRYIVRIFGINNDIRNLYWLAVFRGGIFNRNFDRLVFEVKDSLKYMQPKLAPQSYKKSKYYDPTTVYSSSWENENLYCYDLTVPEPQFDTILYNHMITDLNLYLNLNGRWERRLKECYVLTLKKKSDISLVSSNELPEIIYREQSPIDSDVYVPTSLHHQSIDKLIKSLNMCINKDQIVDGTGLPLDGKFDFDLSELQKGFDATQIDRLLKKYGLELKREIRIVPLFVISEN